MSAFGQNTSGWPLEILSWDVDKAYPGLEYDYRLGVRGGTYPYTFTLIKGPQNMSLDSNKDIITWTTQIESNGNVVKIRINDSERLSLDHQFTIDAAQGNFRFVAPNGSDTSDGTEAHPWASIKHAIETATNANYVYVKAGTHPVADNISGNECSKFLAYPGHNVTLMGAASTSKAQIWLNGSGNYIFQGFNCDTNDIRWFFSANAKNLENLIIRKNHMYNVYSNDWENPAFLFFWDQGSNPNGQQGYKNIVVQENIFHDLENPNNHGASITMYDVQNMLYEDNVAYDIDGRGVGDKDDGFKNTFRNNVFYDCEMGVGLFNQYSQSSIEVNYNLIYNCKTGIQVGSQPGYLKDIFIHHNTVVGSISFGGVLNNGLCSNINIYNNILGDGLNFSCQFAPIKVDDAGGGYHYEYPYYLRELTDDVLFIDKNLVWAANSNKIAGYNWGIPAMDISQWHSALFDQSGISVKPELDPQYALSPTNQYYGIYGRDHINQTPTSLEKLEDKEKFSFKLYPNPASTRLSVSGGFEIGGQGKVGIYDLYFARDKNISNLTRSYVSLYDNRCFTVYVRNLFR